MILKISKRFRRFTVFNWLNFFKKDKPEASQAPVVTEFWETIKNFKSSKFDSPDEPGSGHAMNHDLIRKLDRIRIIIGKPLHISSGYRTKAHNKSLIKRGYKASKNSSHMQGLAVDVLCSDDETRFRLVSAALGQGITRIGIAAGFVHLDVDINKNQWRMWRYA